DGRLLAPVREPKGWFASARHLHPETHTDAATSIAVWLPAARNVLAARRRLGDAVHIVPYERLVQAPREVMGGVARWLGIEDRPSLVEPTFNGLPIRANSSFRVESGGILQTSAERWRSEL